MFVRAVLPWALPWNQKIVDTKKKEFVLAGQDVKKKDAIVRQVYSAIQELKPPGRFLKKSQEGKHYCVQDKKITLGKIKNALSVNNATIRENLTKSGQIKAPKSLMDTKKPKMLKPGKKQKISSEDWKRLSDVIDKLWYYLEESRIWYNI